MKAESLKLHIRGYSQKNFPFYDMGKIIVRCTHCERFYNQNINYQVKLQYFVVFDYFSIKIQSFFEITDI